MKILRYFFGLPKPQNSDLVIISLLISADSFAWTVFEVTLELKNFSAVKTREIMGSRHKNPRVEGCSLILSRFLTEAGVMFIGQFL